MSKYGHVQRYLDSVKDFKERLTGGQSNINIRISQVPRLTLLSQASGLVVKLTTSELKHQEDCVKTEESQESLTK